MKKLLTTLCIALSLGACGVMTPPPASTSSGPVLTEPLRQTNIDEKAVKIAFDSYDALLTAVDGLVAAGVIKPGSPTALKVANGLQTMRVALNTAALAQRAGNADSYLAALADAKAAVATVKAALQETRQ